MRIKRELFWGFGFLITSVIICPRPGFSYEENQTIGLISAALEELALSSMINIDVERSSFVEVKPITENHTFFDAPCFQEKEEDEPLSFQGLDLIQKDKNPKHLCLIMNGNRRWAEKRGMSATEGHWEGTKTAARILKCAAQLGIKTVTLSVLTNEHMQGDRPQEEIEGFFKIMTLGLLWWFSGGAASLEFPMVNTFDQDDLSEVKSIEQSVRIKVIGNLSILPSYLQKNLEKLQEETSSNSDMTLILPVAYSGRDEIRRTIIKMIKDMESGAICKEDISKQLIESYLDTAETPNVDLFVYTGGSHWINSAWHLYNAECFFSPILWPDFCEQDLVNTIVEFQKRKEKCEF